MSRNRTFGALLASALAVALLVVAPARAVDDPEVTREVHSQIGTATGTFVKSTSPTTPVVGGGAHLKCVLPGAGVPNTAVLIDGVEAGREFALTADAGSWQEDFEISFFPSSAAAAAGCDGATPTGNLAHKNHAGDEHSLVPAGATAAVVTLAFGDAPASFTYTEFDRGAVAFPSAPRRPTVVAVIEAGGFSPYHFDFAGHQHPWNLDSDPTNDIDFSADPSSWLPGYPGANELNLTIPGPADGGMDVSGLATGPDAAAWAGMKLSTRQKPELYRIPGTKIVGAIHFGPKGTCSPVRTDTTPRNCDSFYDNNDSHATRTSSVAAGNIHGTCPECVFVLVKFDGLPGVDSRLDAALDWVAHQSWIDVVTNSYAMKESYAFPTAVPRDVLLPATGAGQSWIWASGNGVDGNFFVPNQTYGWGYSAADWDVTVGAVNGVNQQPEGGGWPNDITSYGTAYPSAGSNVANGTSTLDGTSNAAPVVAGTFAKVEQLGRDLLGDSTPGHHDGIVAEGLPRPCDRDTVTACPLADGVLTRAEIQSTIYENVLPSPVRPDAQYQSPQWTVTNGASWKPAALRSATMGHGVVYGRLDPGRFATEQRRLLDGLRGAVSPYARPPGERSWMTADSRCRQRLWGRWDEGYYHDGTEPTFDPNTDQPAIALYAACTPIPQDALAVNVPGL